MSRGRGRGALPTLSHPYHTRLSQSWLLLANPLPGAPPPRPGGNPGVNLKSISLRCHPILVAFVWAEETIDLPLGCLQGGYWSESTLSS